MVKKTKLTIPEGEDDTSFSRWNKLLQDESLKLRPNKSVVSEAMKVSFAMRRNDIISKSPQVVDILTNYPFLRDSSEVKNYIGTCCIY